MDEPIRGPRVMGGLVRVIGPFLLIALVAVGFLKVDPLSDFRGSVPAAEALMIERIVVDDAGLGFLVRSEGAEAVSIAQVQVDGAYWRFEQSPPGPLRRLATTWIKIPYPWIEGEAHHITLLTGTGTPFEYTIDVAVPTPEKIGGDWVFHGLVGLFVGVVPIVLGMLFFPAIRRASPDTMGFILALTMGLLAFLFVDTLSEALKFAGEAAEAFSMREMIWIIALLTAIGLFVVSRRLGDGIDPAMLSWTIALGIGLHNLGEGLAIGGALSGGAVALGSFLVIGFTLHNITEGIGIVAPLAERRPGLPMLCGLAALAGLPAVLGLWLGVQAVGAHWSALAMAVGAGAILQVLLEIGLMIRRRYLGDGTSKPVGGLLAGGTLGLAIMYATSLIVTT
jgi:zinc transporter, ZIP family